MKVAPTMRRQRQVDSAIAANFFFILSLVRASVDRLLFVVADYVTTLVPLQDNEDRDEMMADCSSRLWLTVGVV